MADEWTQLIARLGYNDKTEMLRDLYIDHGLTTGRLAELLGVTRTTVLHHLKACGIERRGRGGKNTLSPQHRKLYRMDQRLIYILTAVRIKFLTGADESTIHNYRNQGRRSTE